MREPRTGPVVKVQVMGQVGSAISQAGHSDLREWAADGGSVSCPLLSKVSDPVTGAIGPVTSASGKWSR